MDYISVRIMFSSLEDAVDALIMVLDYARSTDKEFTFGSLSAEQIYASGLIIMGDAEAIVDDLSKLPGVLVYPE